MDKPKTLRRGRLATVASYFGPYGYKNLSEANVMHHPVEGIWMKPARKCDRERQRPAARWDADPGYSGAPGISMSGWVH